MRWSRSSTKQWPNIGLGSVSVLLKQERWIARHLGRVEAPWMVGVGRRSTIMAASSVGPARLSSRASGCSGSCRDARLRGAVLVVAGVVLRGARKDYPGAPGAAK